MRFQRFSARRTVDLKARTVVMNQGLDLDLRLDSFVITGACWSRMDEKSGIVSNQERVKRFWGVGYKRRGFQIVKKGVSVYGMNFSEKNEVLGKEEELARWKVW